MPQVQGKVAAILDRNTIVVNRGVRDGISNGNILYLYSNVGPFRDPDTGEDLGMTTKVWGKLRVSVVEERFCVATTEYEYAPVIDMSAMLAVFQGRRIELPVRGDQITTQLTRIEVGSFAVILTPDKPENMPLVDSDDESLLTVEPEHDPLQIAAPPEQSLDSEDEKPEEPTPPLLSETEGE